MIRSPNFRAHRATQPEKEGQTGVCPSKEESAASARLSYHLPLPWRPGSWHLLLGRRLVAAALTSSLSWQIGYFERLLQREIKARLRRDFHLLALGEDLDARTGAAADRSADRSPKGCAAADGCGAALAAGCAGLFHVAGLDVVGSALENDTGQD